MSESFIPKDEKSFKMMVQGADFLIRSGRLPKKIAQHYEQFIKDVDLSKEIDINDPKNRRIFLACKKLLKRKEKAPVSVSKKGKFDENMPYLGASARENLALRAEYEQNPAYQALYKGIYEDDGAEARFKMIPVTEMEKAKAISDKLLAEDMAKWGIPQSDLSTDFSDWYRTCVNCISMDNEWNDWNLQLSQDSQLSDADVKDGMYCPFSTILGHELLHIQQTMPGMSQREFEGHAGHNELAPTLYLIERQDRIYKEMHHIPLGKEVDYPHKLTIAGKEVNLGLLANTFRKWQEKYPNHNLEALLLTPEAKDFIKQLAPNATLNKTQQADKEEERARLLEMEEEAILYEMGKIGYIAEEPRMPMKPNQSKAKNRFEMLRRAGQSLPERTPNQSEAEENMILLPLRNRHNKR